MNNTNALLHFDFSENYGCKYSEVQSAHFGGSKSQITLHTSVLYYKNGFLLEMVHQVITNLFFEYLLQK